MEKPCYILGISCFYHDAAACLLKDGEVVAAASEERFTRKKQDEDFPRKAVEFCLKQAGIGVSDLDHVCFYEKPILKFERLLMTYIRTWPWGLVSFVKGMRSFLGKKLWVGGAIKKELGWKGEVCYVPHHLSHAAAAFYASGFEEAAVLTIDGVGEWSTATVGYGKGLDLDLDEELVFPHSVGLLYSAFTYYLGFKVNSAEYKVMGLAPYGEPKYVEKIKELVKIYEDGSVELDMRYFTYEHGLTMVGKRFEEFFGVKVRKENEPLTQFQKDMAASLQVVTEEIVLKMAAYAKGKHNAKRICLAGGVALNCVANGRVLKEGGFEEVYAFPASGDAGGALGAAFYLYHHVLRKERKGAVKTVYLGPEYNANEIRDFLTQYEIPFEEFVEEDLFREVAEMLAQNKIVGMFQGRMEFGPRALGNRSILADPRQEENWQRVNLRIKFRESFRPFAPTVLEDKLNEYFEIDVPTPYMLLTAQTKKEGLPAVTHVDGSARIQSVSAEQNHRYYRMIEEFYKKTGCPVVINTSFNVRGEPIVCSPEDAMKGFLRTEIDALVLENFVLRVEKLDKEGLKKKFVLEVFEND